ncbi:hypothetical protein H6G00_01230 [Leptolyngbya sp. FACHB-541]|uniref:hypothetical protein n=1 Tax=Leptolyngbya sp. FACHB-541 TaxID=2692810 RepID=UPI0016855977|nr:hypothetical protein [Leptolyngbya sp. FACHB-541]MBD1995252.1 hypothetical protein [Leptolyngbya sp. FACHB-541]
MVNLEGQGCYLSNMQDSSPSSGTTRRLPLMAQYPSPCLLDQVQQSIQLKHFLWLNPQQVHKRQYRQAEAYANLVELLGEFDKALF